MQCSRVIRGRVVRPPEATLGRGGQNKPRVPGAVMQDMKSHREKLRADAAECALIRDLATDPQKRMLFTRLADHLSTLAGEVEAAIAASRVARQAFKAAISSSGALDLTFAGECAASRVANVKSAPLAGVL